MTTPLPPRTPWPKDFPDVIVHADVRERDEHSRYADAKSGDADAAFTLADALIADRAIADIATMIEDDRKTVILPVVADETTGFNAIPDAMAHILGKRLGIDVETGTVVQANKVGHTRAAAFQRLVTPAAFDGPVRGGFSYILVDDHIGLGGTLANLKGHIEMRGGTVIGMTTLTQSRDARRIAPRPETQSMLWARHGKDLDSFWYAQFGYGIDCLTEVECQNLCRQPSLAAIEAFLAKAAIEARGRGIEPTVG